MTALLMGTFSSFLLFCGQEAFGRWAMEAESKDRGGRFQPRHLPKIRCYFGLSFPTAGLPARPTPHHTNVFWPNPLIAFFPHRLAFPYSGTVRPLRKSAKPPCRHLGCRH